MRHWTLSNGATVTFCRTPFSSDTITFGAMAVGGWRELPREADRLVFQIDSALSGVGALKASEASAAAAHLDAFASAECHDFYRALSGGCSPRGECMRACVSRGSKLS